MAGLPARRDGVMRLAVADAVTAVLLRAVQRGVGAADDRARVFLAGDDLRDTEAGRDDDRLGVPANGMLFEIVAQHLRDAPRAGERRVGQQDEELLAAVAALHV